MVETEKTGGAARDPKPAPAPGKPGRKMRWVLVASLGLNLLILGIVAGGWIDRSRAPDRRMPREVAFGPFTEALDSADRRALRGAFLDQSDKLREMRTTARDDTARLIAALRADPYDPAATEAAFSGLRSGTMSRMELGERLLLDRIGQMDTPQRQGFADRLAERLQGDSRKRDGGRD